MDEKHRKRLLALVVALAAERSPTVAQGIIEAIYGARAHMGGREWFNDHNPLVLRHIDQLNTLLEDLGVDPVNFQGETLV